MDTRLSTSFRGDFTGTRLVFAFLLFNIALIFFIVTRNGLGRKVRFFFLRPILGGVYMGCPQGKLQGEKGYLFDGDRRAVWRFGGNFLLSCFVLFVAWGLAVARNLGPKAERVGSACYIPRPNYMHIHTLLPTCLPTYPPTITCGSWDGLCPS